MALMTCMQADRSLSVAVNRWTSAAWAERVLERAERMAAAKAFLHWVRMGFGTWRKQGGGGRGEGHRSGEEKRREEMYEGQEASGRTRVGLLFIVAR